MAQILEISPELLLQQSQQMQQLKLSYEALMEKMLADINGINGSWSQLLANNFTAKIADAQKSFLGVFWVFRLCCKTVLTLRLWRRQH